MSLHTTFFCDPKIHYLFDNIHMQLSNSSMSSFQDYNVDSLWDG